MRTLRNELFIYFSEWAMVLTMAPILAGLVYGWSNMEYFWTLFMVYSIANCILMHASYVIIRVVRLSLVWALRH